MSDTRTEYRVVCADGTVPREWPNQSRPRVAASLDRIRLYREWWDRARPGSLPHRIEQRTVTTGDWFPASPDNPETGETT